jgi:hypothetical protein
MQISEQLAAMSNGTQAYVPQTLPSYHPSATVIVVNALWFLSLGFSLTCALAATLVKQWARGYLTAIDGRAIPSQRAAIRSYLYEGVMKFKVTDVVETIPTLLHISLFLFLTGLFGFLFPINLAIAYLALSILVVSAGFYAIVTALPLINYQCPYQTPLSAGVWRVRRSILHLWRGRRSHGSAGDEPYYRVQRQESIALMQSSGLYEREKRAIKWTMTCLTEDGQLEPFIEGIPGFLRAGGPRNGPQNECNRRIMLSLMRSSEIRLCVRIFNLLLTCYRGSLVDEITREKRITACLNAIWSLTDILLLTPDAYWINDFDLRTAWMIERVSNDNIGVSKFAKCTRAVVAGKLLRDMEHCLSKDQHGRLATLRNLIETASTLYANPQSFPERLGQVVDEVHDSIRDGVAFHASLEELNRRLDDARFIVLIDLVSTITKGSSIPPIAPRAIYYLANNLLTCAKSSESQANFLECLTVAIENGMAQDFPRLMISVLLEVATSGVLDDPDIIQKAKSMLKKCKEKRPTSSDDVDRALSALAEKPRGLNRSNRLNIEHLYQAIADI